MLMRRSHPSMLVSEAKQRLPVPHPREHRADGDGRYSRHDGPEQYVGDQEDRAGHRQGEEGQPHHGEAVGRPERRLLCALAP